MKKYPNGYKEKLDYHREKLRAATTDKDIAKCLESIQYFERKQLEWENENLKKEVKELGSTFTAKGLVYGNYWGGGEGAYPTIKFRAETLPKLEKAVQEAFEDGGIDSGMGYQSLIGAVLEVTEERTIEYKGLEYVSLEYTEMTIGDLTEEQVNFINSHMPMIY